MSVESIQDLRRKELRRELLKEKERLLSTSLSRAKGPSFIKRLQRALRVERLLSQKSHKP
jgi:hypothetical protein